MPVLLYGLTVPTLARPPAPGAGTRRRRGRFRFRPLPVPGPGRIFVSFLLDVSKMYFVSLNEPCLPGYNLDEIQGITYTNRCITQSWTGVRQYGQIFMLAEQRSHAS